MEPASDEAPCVRRAPDGPIAQPMCRLRARDGDGLRRIDRGDAPHVMLGLYRLVRVTYGEAHRMKRRFACARRANGRVCGTLAIWMVSFL